MHNMDSNHLHNYPFLNPGGVSTHIYNFSSSLDITLFLKIPTGYYKAHIKFNSYGGRGLSDNDSGQAVSQMEKE
jgi:formylmethanofuran dehydrogenase subunit A